MNTGIQEQNGGDEEEQYGEQVSERGLWIAVLLQAIEDWRSCNIRRQKEAERFFFKSEKDFATVCRGAGLEPSSVLAKLQKMKHVANRSWTESVWSRNLNTPARAIA
jgi:hypothetical protein